MPSVAVCTSRIRIVFDGQSLNLQPSFAKPYPKQLMVGRSENYCIPAVSGMGWEYLKNVAQYRLNSLINEGGITIVIMVGGTNDYLDGHSGATAYADMKAYTTAIRALGADYVINTTTQPNVGLGVNTTVAAGSVGAGASSFTGSQTLHLTSTAAGGGALTSGTVRVQTTGTMATITYGSVSGNDLLNCNWTGGTGTIPSNATARQSLYQNQFDGNALVVANSDNAWDGVADLANASGLTDPTDSSKYFDGLHPSNGAATIMAATVRPVLDTLVKGISA